MSEQNDISKHGKTTKRTFWGATAFYILIAFEFFYMASPFAVYFYSVYSPVLNFFNESSTFGWMISYFMPHIVVETASPIINAHNTVGTVFAVIGFTGFVIGASQVYYHKLKKKGIVTGGIYNYIRHPQYASFILCSFGLVILWPRYIVLFMFITMLFAYYLLAKLEERECEEKFGQSYIEFKKRTGMFLPFRLFPNKKVPILPASKLGWIVAMLGIYCFTLVVSIGIARIINNYTLDSIYAVYTKDSATISVCKLEEDKVEQVIELALSNSEVKGIIDATNGDENENVKYLNYVLPTEWYVAEIPMNGLGVNGYHRSPQDHNKSEYKIIFTKAEMRSEGNVTGKQIIQKLKSRESLVEVWVDIKEGKVIQVLDVSNDIMYKDIPVAIY